MEKYFKTNKALWDQKTSIHRDSDFYQLEDFKQGKNMLNSIELEALSPVAGKTLLHLQCHFGQDTLCWARMGARATGVDMSTESIALARSLNKELGLKAEFVECNVLDLPQYMKGEFDIVFTSYGTITWLPELTRWAEIINHYLAPGGIFYMVEFHPALYVYDHDNGTPAYDYFNREKPYEEIISGSYADREADLEAKEYFWSHSLQDVFQPLLRQGLQLLDFQEFDYSPYNCFPNMEERAPGEYVFTANGVRIPHLFSLKMQKK